MISIIMPVFNEEKYLEECLNSIINQTYIDWELFAVDDFSQDKSRDILNDYAAKDPRIHVFKNVEKGIIPALEMAYAKSSSSFVTRMDADDKMHPNKLKELFTLISQYPNACVTAKVEYFSENKLSDGFLRYAEWLNKMTENDSHYDEIYKECVVASPCWMMHRDTIELIGGICSDRYPEDYDLIFRLYENDIQIKGIPKILHYWRDHETRASRNDEHYADQGFIDLKMHYLTKLEIPNYNSVILWGAGRAGKLWAKALKGNVNKFQWITDNPNKIGKDIYDVKIEGLSMLEHAKNQLILVAIKSPSFYIENSKFLIELRKKNMVLFLF